jgi:8-oxo-dGTP pyrophosphatase MutT (NUDIX family)
VKRARASAICLAEGHLLVVRLRDPVTNVEALFPPGGGIEPGETPAETATREALEETGLHVTVDRDVTLVETYPFRWAGVDYEVTTHYFAATLDDAFELAIPAVVDAPYNLGASWMPVDAALEAMSVHPSIGNAVARLLRLASRAAWLKHPNVSGPASTLLSIHDQFRAASRRLSVLVDQVAVEDRSRLLRAFMPLAQTLHHHHHAEEAMLFPLVLARTGIAPEELVDDHVELTTAIAAVEHALSTADGHALAKAAVATFDEVLVSHLDREESLVIPVLLGMTPHEAWAFLHG